MTTHPIVEKAAVGLIATLLLLALGLKSISYEPKQQRQGCSCNESEPRVTRNCPHSEQTELGR